jgi:benzoyl-CoA-dihydrodiol lyase
MHVISKNTGTSTPQLDFRTSPAEYRHWTISIDGPVARLVMAVDEDSPHAPGYELKLNSYDIAVDIELYDTVQRLRFEHPEVRAVVITSGIDTMFCAGANIRMLGISSHSHKVNFCKFTNETRNAIEDASQHSGQTYLAALNGSAAGGGYELALATEYLMLIDDGNAAVSLPEVPLLAVLPGTGGLTRIVDKRKVRRDLADVFCTVEEGMKGKRAVEWRLIDETVPRSKFDERVTEKALEFAANSDRPSDEQGIKLERLERSEEENEIRYPFVTVTLDHEGRCATLEIQAPDEDAPASVGEIKKQGVRFWPLAVARAVDDALLHLRFNEPTLGTLIIKTSGGDDRERVSAYDSVLDENRDDWFVREILLYLQRTFKRLDVTSRTTFAFVEPDSCFFGMLADLLFAVDRSYMLDGQLDERPAPVIQLTELNFGSLRMANGLTRLETRFLDDDESVENARKLIGQKLDAQHAMDAGLITYAPDDIDWHDEIRLLLEERASFSPDALTGMEANLRFAGPETLETKIFGRLSAWQNWIFQRPNATGEAGALKLYGTGKRAKYDRGRV